MEVADPVPMRAALAGVAGDDWTDTLLDAMQDRLTRRPHGDLPRWRQILEKLPSPHGVDCRFDIATVSGTGGAPPVAASDVLVEQLMALHPWRKGPFHLHGVDIDAEWRSDRKWQRLVPHLSPLDGRRVLDVGCGNGYYLWRMLGAGARLAVGVDPSLLFWVQFQAVKRLLGGEGQAFVVPLTLEETPPRAGCFDTVFSLGVLYHRRSPIEHLLALKGMLRPGGELAVETLVIDGDADRVLVPADRYAQMRNVWFIPSTAMLERWLRRCGFAGVRTVDVTPTTDSEQRRTAWMRFESLADFLDPDDAGLTREGYPAPTRAIVIASN